MAPDGSEPRQQPPQHFVMDTKRLGPPSMACVAPGDAQQSSRLNHF